MQTFDPQTMILSGSMLVPVRNGGVGIPVIAHGKPPKASSLSPNMNVCAQRWLCNVGYRMVAAGGEAQDRCPVKSEILERPRRMLRSQRGASWGNRFPVVVYRLSSVFSNLSDLGFQYLNGDNGRLAWRAPCSNLTPPVKSHCRMSLRENRTGHVFPCRNMCK